MIRTGRSPAQRRRCPEAPSPPAREGVERGVNHAPALARADVVVRMSPGANLLPRTGWKRLEDDGMTGGGEREEHGPVPPDPSRPRSWNGPMARVVRPQHRQRHRHIPTTGGRAAMTASGRSSPASARGPWRRGEQPTAHGSSTAGRRT